MHRNEIFFFHPHRPCQKNHLNDYTTHLCCPVSSTLVLKQMPFSVLMAAAARGAVLPRFTRDSPGFKPCVPADCFVPVLRKGL